MKFFSIVFALALILAGALLAEAAAIEHAGPWSDIHPKSAMKHFKIYAEPADTDLRTAKPDYSKCTTYSDAGRKATFKFFATWDRLQFQKLGPHTLGVNCINCTPQELGNIYQTEMYLNCKIQDQRPADWTPQGQ
ncbi:hypothetical protein PSEUBRA_005858 [Kalmanozyma brasiliensis GHG001]|uniref:Uncharacterized protein n=1 Tax=Kalmanozyma brasiliensis (strain GHG001) TaxID=1365824 RepID=V5EJS9_KALBG|nr:uncharacterized protein PSEUBRA_005858 [Kalmanozyma brasiliensis GHG001]EST05050.1 hypothetical protein PSEUBRA_005858 [Kalmanozyma brasiliensis GHG001]